MRAHIACGITNGWRRAAASTAPRADRSMRLVEPALVHAQVAQPHLAGAADAGDGALHRRLEVALGAGQVAARVPSPSGQRAARSCGARRRRPCERPPRRSAARSGSRGRSTRPSRRPPARSAPAPRRTASLGVAPGARRSRVSASSARARCTSGSQRSGRRAPPRPPAPARARPGGSPSAAPRSPPRVTRRGPRPGAPAPRRRRPAPTPVDRAPRARASATAAPPRRRDRGRGRAPPAPRRPPGRPTTSAASAASRRVAATVRSIACRGPSNHGAVSSGTSGPRTRSRAIVAASRAESASPGGHRPLGGGDALVELAEVEPVGDERVAGVVPRDPIGAERAPQAADQHADLLARLGRQVVGPQHLGQHVHPDRRAPGDGQRGEERARLAAPDLAGRPAPRPRGPPGAAPGAPPRPGA